MRLDILAGLLQTATLGVIGGTSASIFVSQMPADCKQGILLRLPIDGVPVDVGLPNYYKHSVQVIVRAADQVTGDALIAAAVKALTFEQVTIFNDTAGAFQMQINHLVPRTLPRDYPRLDGQGKEWAVDMNSNYVMAPS